MDDGIANFPKGHLLHQEDRNLDPAFRGGRCGLVKRWERVSVETLTRAANLTGREPGHRAADTELSHHGQRLRLASGALQTCSVTLLFLAPFLSTAPLVSLQLPG